MLGLSYASVPLYRMFCQATGYAGTVKEGKSVEEKIKQREENPNPALDKKAAERELRVWFNSDVAEGMPWRFMPTQVRTHLPTGPVTQQAMRMAQHR
jgi:cytochrome c oxidase assembly protein subunit 11